MTIEPTMNICEIIAILSLGRDLDIKKLSTELENIEYIEAEDLEDEYDIKTILEQADFYFDSEYEEENTMKKQDVLVYKLPGTRANFIIMKNGECVVYGSRSMEKLKEASRKFIEQLKKIEK